MAKAPAEVPHLRTSERRAFKRCPARWHWGWVQGLEPKIAKPNALWFGTGIHLALQHRYQYPGKRRGFDVLKTWRDHCGDVQMNAWLPGGDEELEWISGKELGEVMLGAYLDEYGKDERWSVISAEQTFEIPILRPNGSVQVLYDGTFDLVARDDEGDGSLWLWDHKTAKAIQTAHLSLDDQGGSYWAVAAKVLRDQGLIGKDEKLDGILYNFLRKAKPDTRPKNAAGQATNKPIKRDYLEQLHDAGCIVHAKMSLDRLTEVADTYGIQVLGEVSKSQPTASFLRHEVWRTETEQRTQFRKIQNEATWMQAVKDRKLPVIKNPTADCHWDCPFFLMCELHEAGDDWKEYRDATYTKRDPYADHRKSAHTEEETQ